MIVKTRALKIKFGGLNEIMHQPADSLIFIGFEFEKHFFVRYSNDNMRNAFNFTRATISRNVNR